MVNVKVNVIKIMAKVKVDVKIVKVIEVKVAKVKVGKVEVKDMVSFFQGQYETCKLRSRGIYLR